MFKLELGQRVKDKITGFKGIIMARVQYLTGCNQYGICPEALTKEGKKPEWEYFDETRLEVVKGGKVLLLEDTQKQPGFDGQPPQKS